jgi:DNA-directed RNA polymerase subunit RPC12/RpoP
MALYRCAACGSPNVVMDTQAGGIEYNYLKGAVGTVVLGAGGAAAGIGSKEQKVFKCPDCGLTLSYPMEQESKLIIDLGVADANARDNLKLMGISVPWSYFTSKYKNIEEGTADQIIKARAEQEKQQENWLADNRDRLTFECNQRTKELAQKVKKRMDLLMAELLVDEKEFASIEAAQQKWEETAAPALAQRESFIYKDMQKIDREYAEKEVQLKSKMEEKALALTNDFEHLISQQNELEEKLAHLGIFKMNEKKTTKSQLEEVLARLEKNGAERESVNIEFNTLHDKLAADKDLMIKQLREGAAKRFPLFESPVERHERFNQIRSREKLVDTINSQSSIPISLSLVNAILFAIEEHGGNLQSGLTDGINMPDLLMEVADVNFTFQRVVAIFRTLVAAGLVVRSDLSGKPCWNLPQ